MNKLFELGRRYSPELAALLVVTLWGTNFVFQKAALAEFDVFAFNFLRFLGMVGLGWAVLYFRGVLSRRRSPEMRKPFKLKIARADWGRVALAGFVGYALYIQLSSIGLNYTTAFSNALLIATAPLFAALLLWVLRLEQIRLGQWLAMLLALVGVFLFLLDKFQIGAKSANIGDLICLVAAFFFAAYNVINKPLLSRYPAPVLTAYSLTIGAVPVLLLSLPGFLGQDWGRVTLAGWGALLWSIVAPVYFAWTVWSWVNARLGVARTSAFMYLVPVIGGVTSWWLLGEGFGFQKIGGALLILGSLVLIRYQANRKPTSVEPVSKDEPQLELVTK